MKNGKKIKRKLNKTDLKNQNDKKKIVLQLLDDAYLYHFKQFSKYDTGKQILKGIFKSFTKHYLYKGGNDNDDDDEDNDCTIGMNCSIIQAAKKPTNNPILDYLSLFNTCPETIDHNEEEFYKKDFFADFKVDFEDAIEYIKKKKNIKTEVEENVLDELEIETFIKNRYNIRLTGKLEDVDVPIVYHKKLLSKEKGPNEDNVTSEENIVYNDDQKIIDERNNILKLRYLLYTIPELKENHYIIKKMFKLINSKKNNLFADRVECSNFDEDEKNDTDTKEDRQIKFTIQKIKIKNIELRKLISQLLDKYLQGIRDRNKLAEKKEKYKDVQLTQEGGDITEVDQQSIKEIIKENKESNEKIKQAYQYHTPDTQKPLEFEEAKEAKRRERRLANKRKQEKAEKEKQEEEEKQKQEEEEKPKKSNLLVNNFMNFDMEDEERENDKQNYNVKKDIIDKIKDKYGDTDIRDIDPAILLQEIGEYYGNFIKDFYQQLEEDETYTKDTKIDFKDVNSMMKSISQIPVIGMAVPTLYTLDNLIKEMISTDGKDGSCSAMGSVVQHGKDTTDTKI